MLLDLAGVFDNQASLHLQRGAVVGVAVAAFFLAVLQSLQPVSAKVKHGSVSERARRLDALTARVDGEVQLQGAGEVLDGGHLFKDFTDPFPQEPIIRSPLHFDWVRPVQKSGEPGKTSSRPATP